MEKFNESNYSIKKLKEVDETTKYIFILNNWLLENNSLNTNIFLIIEKLKEISKLLFG